MYYNSYRFVNAKCQQPAFNIVIRTESYNTVGNLLTKIARNCNIVMNTREYNLNTY